VELKINGSASDSKGLVVCCYWAGGALKYS